jgi:[ribosomal protein S5]-alanine N-acetyltransferase
VDFVTKTAPLAVPTLEAGPFRLRPFRLSDLDVVREASQDEHIVSITTVPAQFFEEEGRLFIQRQWQRATDGTGYSFAIADAATDQALGLMGLWLRNIDEGRGCLGYWVASSGRGRGAAQQAVSSVSRWALDHLQIPRLELYVEPWNEASVRTAERAGFQCEGLLRSWQAVGAERRDMWMYSLLRSDLPSD